MATTPDVAVRDMLQVSRNHLQNSRVLFDEPWGLKRLVVFSYTVQPAGAAPHKEFGHAQIEMRAGWSASSGLLAADAAPPARVTYASAQVGNAIIVYGKFLNPQVRGVEVTFDNGQIVMANSTAEGFFASAANAQTVRELRALDAQGNVLQRYTVPNLYETARWSK